MQVLILSLKSALRFEERIYDELVIDFGSIEL